MYYQGHRIQEVDTDRFVCMYQFPYFFEDAFIISGLKTAICTISNVKEYV